MRRQRNIWFAFAGMLAGLVQLQGQSLDERFSVVDEGTLSRLNLTTPINEQNRILPQAIRSNLGTANLFLGFGAFSGSVNLSAASDDLSQTTYKQSLRELSLDLSITDELDVTIGKKILKWGTGYAFNPTGVVEPLRSPSDPTDRLGQNEGRQMLGVNAFLGKSSLSLVYINDSQVESWKLVRGTQELALRASTLVGGCDLSVVGHYREHDRFEEGANWSSVIGEGLELHGEILAKRGSSNLYHRIITSDDPEQVFTEDPYAPIYEDSDRIFYKLVLGGQYTFDGGPNIVLEYYHDAEGLNKTEWQRWLKFVKFQNSIQNGTVATSPDLVEPSRLNLLWALRTLSPRGAMSDYLFGREYYTWGNWTVEFLQFLNAQDLSAVLIPSATYRFSENDSCYTRLTGFVGGPDSEFGVLFDQATFSLGVRFQI